MIASPCNGVCAVDPGTGVCRGCLRTLDEIADWAAASDEERRGVLERASQRTIASPDEAGSAPPAGSPEVDGSPPLEPTDRWWAQRWIDKATPGEIAAMRDLLLGDDTAD